MLLTPELLTSKTVTPSARKRASICSLVKWIGPGSVPRKDADFTRPVPNCDLVHPSAQQVATHATRRTDFMFGFPLSGALPQSASESMSRWRVRQLLTR